MIHIYIKFQIVNQKEFIPFLKELLAYNLKSSNVKNATYQEIIDSSANINVCHRCIYKGRSFTFI